MSAFLCSAALGLVASVLVASDHSVRAAADEAPVQGIVTVNGRPVAAGKVILHGQVGKPVETPVKDGKYLAARVPTGEKTVTIEGKGVPAKYSSVETSPLKAAIVAGQNELDFELID